MPTPRPRTRAFAESFRGKSREDLEASQRRALHAQLKRLASVPFFSSRLANVRGALEHPDPIELARFSDVVPMMTKADVLADQELAPPWGSRLSVDPSLVKETTLTNGTSGVGREAFGLTTHDIELNALSGALLMKWAGLGRNHTVANLFPVGFGLAGLAEGHAASLLGWNSLQTGFLSTPEKLEAFHRFGVDVVWVCTPSYLARLLAEASETRGLEQVSLIMLAGEAYPAELVDSVEQEHGIRLIEAYGSTQLAVFGAGTCPATLEKPGAERLLHLLEPWLLAEVVGPQGDPVDEGEEGELVVTPLYREASPVVRFRTGDRVRLLPAGACTCGRPFRLVEAGSIARIDDMMKVKGVNLWPSTIDRVVLAEPGAVDYKGEVGLDEAGREFVRVVIETTRSPTSGEHRSLEDRLRGATGLHVDVVCNTTTVAELRAQPGHKARRWTDTRQRSLATLAGRS